MKVKVHKKRKKYYESQNLYKFFNKFQELSIFMDAFALQLVESPAKSEKKRFCELFESLTSFLYSSLKEISSHETTSQDVTKLVDELQTLQIAQKIKPKIHKNPNSEAPNTIKKPHIEKIETKNTKGTHHHTNSLDIEKKNKTNKIQNSIFTPVMKESEKAKNMNLKHLHPPPKINGNVNTYAFLQENSPLRNGNKIT